MGRHIFCLSNTELKILSSCLHTFIFSKKKQDSLLDTQNEEPILPSGNHRSLLEKVGCLAPVQERHPQASRQAWGCLLLPYGQPGGSWGSFTKVGGEG